MAKKGRGGRPQKRVAQPGQAAAQPKDDSKKQAAEQRRLAYRRQQQRKRLLQNALIILVIVAVVGGLGYWIVGGWYRDRNFDKQLASASCTVDSKTDPGVTGQHSDSATFEVNPPSGGVHYPSNARSGDYSQGTVPPDGQIVHSQEHGYITLWYRPDATDVLPALREILDRHRGDVLIVPRASLPTKVAATAWSKRLLCDSVEPATLEKFTSHYIGKGPEKVPRG